MAQSILSIKEITFSYINQEKQLFRNLTTSFPGGWTAVAGPNGSGKSTLLAIMAGKIKPDRGAVIAPGTVLYVEQVCLKVPDSLFDLFARQDKEALKLIATLKLQYDWPYRWETLSQGEKKRCQLGAAIAADPAVLLLDEPVNHLDRESLELAVAAMALYEGCGVLVSHKRGLLDRFCSRTLFLPEGKVYSGGYTKAQRERERVKTEQRREYEKARHEMVRLRKEASRRRALAAAQQKRRSKKHLDRKDSDGRAKLDLARISGKDGTGGRLLRQMDGRLAQASDRLDGFDLKKEIDLGITFDSKISHSDFIWRQEKGHIPYNGESGPGVSHDELSLKPGDRILLCGANGAGKTTLLRHINHDLGETVWYLDQELTEEQLKETAVRFDLLNNEEKGRVLSSMRRMGADPGDFLTIHRWSPGEMKKLQIAISLDQDIPGKIAVLLDEPVNHLDLECRTLLEEALSRFPGVILFVSHDEDFLNAEITARWHINTGKDGATISNNYQ